jgi:hypothetical protein
MLNSAFKWAPKNQNFKARAYIDLPKIGAHATSTSSSEGVGRHRATSDNPFAALSDHLPANQHISPVPRAPYLRVVFLRFLTSVPLISIVQHLAHRPHCETEVVRWLQVQFAGTHNSLTRLPRPSRTPTSAWTQRRTRTSVGSQQTSGD